MTDINIKIKGKVYTSLEAIASALLKKEIKLSDVPSSKHEPTKRKLKSKPLKPTEPPSLTPEDVGDRGLYATLIHHGEDVLYRFHEEQFFSEVPVSILLLSAQEQLSTVRKLVLSNRSMWSARKQSAAETFKNKCLN